MNIKEFKSKERSLMKISATALIMGSVLLSAPVAAQMDEVIVTGTKRAIGVQDVPIAVTAVTGAQLEKTYQTDIRALSNMAPNVVITQQTGFNAAAPGIRGSGAISILVTQDSSTAIIIDDMPLTHVQSQLLEMVDIDQVEIFRGPQGTLFGKNTTSGALNITTKKPDLEEFSGKMSGRWGRLATVDDRDSYVAKGAVNIPIVEGQLGLRISAIYDKSDGAYTNDKDTATFPGSVPLFGGAPFAAIYPALAASHDLSTVGEGEALNGKDVFAGRAKLLWQPMESYSAQFTYEMVRDRSDSPPGVNETPVGQGYLMELLGFPGILALGADSKKEIFSTGITNQANGLNVGDGHAVNVDGYYLHQDFNFDNFSVKSITGFRDQSENLASTYTGEAFNSLFDASRNTTRETWHQEIRMVTDFDGPFNFIAGGNYDHEEVRMLAYATVGLFGLLFGTEESFNIPTFTGAEQDRDTWALYGDGTYELTENWNLSAGLRYTHDDKTFSRFQNNGGPCSALTEAAHTFIVDGDCLDSRSNAVDRFGLTGPEVDNFSLPDGAKTRPAFGLVLNDVNKKFSELTWRVASDYRFSDEVMGYATVGTGFLSGGFTETCSSVATCLPFKMEKSTNFELGLKTDLAENTVRMNLAAFYIKYRDLQRNQVVSFFDAFGTGGQETITVNAGKSRAFGFEVETTWTPPNVDGLTVNVNFGYIDHEYKDFAMDLDGDGVKDSMELVDINGDGELGELKDLKVPFSSKITFNAGVTYDYPLRDGASGTLTSHVNVHHRSEAEMVPFNTPDSQLEAKTELTAALTWTEPDGNYYVGVYGKNLLNEVKRMSSNPVAGLWVFGMYSDPREIGLEFGASF